MRTRLTATLAAAALFAGSGLVATADDLGPVDLPVLSPELQRGTTTSVVNTGEAIEVDRVVDGDISDWVGTPSGYGGTMVRSAGELIYQDHIFDAWGADDGADASRVEFLGPLNEVHEGSYRLEQLAQQDLGGQLGADGLPQQVSDQDHYGNIDGHADAADIVEVRAVIDGADLRLLVRLTTLRPTDNPAVLVLADRVDGGSYSVPFDSGLTTGAETAALATRDGLDIRDLTTGASVVIAGPPDPEPMVAVNEGSPDDDEFTNAVEIRIPLDLVDRQSGVVHLAVATGLDSGHGTLADLGTGPNVANVAFRPAEPVRVWMEKRQALALLAGTIDPFFTEVDPGADPAATETLELSAGYHDRIYESDRHVATEGGKDGLWQHYGLYLPEGYDPSVPAPLQWWLHWRGGEAHTAGAVIPEMFRQLGDDHGAVVVSPRGRGSSSWYVGTGHVDINQVWDDVLANHNIDESRTFVTGHSMGGWGSWLLSVLYPDRIAAAMPYAGPVTQGAWTGIDFEGCDDFQYDEYTPCYVETNGSDPRAQHHRKLLQNLRHTPVAIFQGTNDELVPVSGVTRQVERLVELGYRHRYYLSPGYEHYTHPVMDQWGQGGDYLHQFAIPENPHHVTYTRDMPFERATETVRSFGIPLDFSFDSAWWMSGLTPVDDVDGVAHFDGSSRAIPADNHLVAPDTDAPTSTQQWGPFLVAGLQWLDTSPVVAPSATWNGFDISLGGASAVTLDLAGMLIDVDEPIMGVVDSDAALSLGLRGFDAMPAVLVDGVPVEASLHGDTLAVDLPAGISVVRIGSVVHIG
ncbi:MAG TPA: prolyl oligopeptidase family serine peptidase [Acidimicrobiales bacterium]